MSDVPYVLTRAGVRMPAILYGTAWKKERTAPLVTTALRLGFRGFDTACQPKHYDEAGVGAGLASLETLGLTRADLYLQTKFTPLSGQDPARVPYDPAATLPDQVAQSCAVSLANLRTDRLDGLILHSPLSTIERTLEAWRAMEALVDAGRVAQLGISNCYDLTEFDALWTEARIKPAVLQNRFYGATAYDRHLRARCREVDVVYQSFWTLTANPDVLNDPLVRSIAKRHGRTPAQVLFRYLTLIGVVPLTGTTSEQHMQEDLAIFDFVLEPDEREAMDRLF